MRQRLRKSKIQRLAGEHPAPQNAIARFRGLVGDTALFSPLALRIATDRAILDGLVEPGRKVRGMLNWSLTGARQGRQPKSRLGGIGEGALDKRGSALLKRFPLAGDKTEISGVDDGRASGCKLVMHLQFGAHLIQSG